MSIVVIKQKLISVFNYVRARFTLQNAGAIIVLVVIIAVTISTSKVMLRNYVLQKRVNEFQKRATIAQYESDKQRLLNQYFATDAYLDIAARRQLARGLPGEKLVIIPSSVATTYAKPLPEFEEKPAPAPKKSLVEAILDKLSKSE